MTVPVNEAQRRDAAERQKPKTLDELIASFDAKEEEAKLSNLKREEQVRAIYDEIIQRYQPGGTFQAKGEALLGRQKTKDVGTRMQHAIGSGLFNTSATGAMGQSWEQDVGAEMRLGLEDTMMQRLSQAQLGKADFIERIENRYPNTEQLGGLAQQAGQSTRYYGSPGLEDTGTSYAEQQAINEGTYRAGTAAGERTGGELNAKQKMNQARAYQWMPLVNIEGMAKTDPMAAAELQRRRGGSTKTTTRASTPKTQARAVSYDKAANEAVQRSRKYGPTRASFGIPESTSSTKTTTTQPTARYGQFTGGGGSGQFSGTGSTGSYTTPSSTMGVWQEKWRQRSKAYKTGYGTTALSR